MNRVRFCRNSDPNVTSRIPFSWTVKRRLQWYWQFYQDEIYWSLGAITFVLMAITVILVVRHVL